MTSYIVKFLMCFFSIPGEASSGHQQCEATVGGDARFPHTEEYKTYTCPRTLRKPHWVYT